MHHHIFIPKNTWFKNTYLVADWERAKMVYNQQFLLALLVAGFFSPCSPTGDI
jgi:hypothetical protein